jgi:2-amino-4-hydroxy-6-hydroxymethyldihydropteridine diphosphokinase
MDVCPLYLAGNRVLAENWGKGPGQMTTDHDEKPVRVYLGVGSNINPYENIERALDAVRERIVVTAVSPLYSSQAVGETDQPDFINGVWAAVTTLTPRELKYGLLRPVEERLERRRGTDRNAARTIDLDLLLYGEALIDEPGLTVPDTGVRRYPFVALPLLELDREIRLPDGGDRLRDLFSGRADEYGLVLCSEFSTALAERLTRGQAD